MLFPVSRLCRQVQAKSGGPKCAFFSIYELPTFIAGQGGPATSTFFWSIFGVRCSQSQPYTAPYAPCAISALHRPVRPVCQWLIYSTWCACLMDADWCLRSAPVLCPLHAFRACASAGGARRVPRQGGGGGRGVPAHQHTVGQQRGADSPGAW